MKTTLVLLSVLISICSHSSFCTAAEAPEAVLDTAGKKLRAGTQYYLLPVGPSSGAGGGLTVENSVNKTCPYDVFQDEYEGQGNPVAFYPVNAKKGVIRVSTDLNVDFLYTITICPQSTLWMIDRYDPSTGQYFVTMGAESGNPGPKTIKNWFKIEKFGDGYKFVHCPTVCSYCKVMCRDLGIFVQSDRRRRLALSDMPYNFVFKET